MIAISLWTLFVMHLKALKGTSQTLRMDPVTPKCYVRGSSLTTLGKWRQKTQVASMINENITNLIITQC